MLGYYLRYSKIAFHNPFLVLFSSHQVFRAKEVMDNGAVAVMKSGILSGAVIDPDRVVIGTEEGLFCVDLDRAGEFVISSACHRQDCSEKASITFFSLLLQ